MSTGYGFPGSLLSLSFLPGGSFCSSSYRDLYLYVFCLLGSVYLFLFLLQ